MFISHASEDKVSFVTPLANELKKHGLRVWFDKFALKVGDSLHQSIEKGLARSRYGVVVFSPKFLAKNWPQAELNGLFAREMDRHKVILPVWHKLSSARMKKELPMLADKVALRSSDGVQAVTRSLIEAIRPELLELDNKQEAAFEAGEAFVTEAKRKYPGYSFAVQSGTFAARFPSAATFTVTNANHRIEIGISDPAIIGKPPGGRVQFFGEGVKKAIDFERTGKPQKWEPGEFRLKDWNIPLMPPHIKGSILEVGGLNLSNSQPRYMRVEVRSRPPVVFPMMEMRPVRRGTYEAEAILSDKEAPLSISLTFSVGPDLLLDTSREVDIKLSWETAGKRVTECKKLIDAIDGLCRGRVLRIADILLDKTILQSSVRAAGRPEPLSDDFGRTVVLAHQIENEFSVSLRMPKSISDDDDKSLFHLDCLLNGRAYGNVEDTQLRLLKADGEMGYGQEAFIKGEWTATFTDAPSNYPGYFPLFGQQIATRNWVRVVEFTPETPSAYLEKFRNAPTGAAVTIEITAKGPAVLRWREDSALKDIEIGTLTQ